MTDVMDDARRIKRGILDFYPYLWAVSRPRKRRLVRWRATCSSISTRMICRTVVTARLNASPRNAQGLAGDSADAGGRVQAP